ncbi:pimeloyl-ACP methyl ester carboxylesterase [Larkinella arboricola]|uniref:Pimeloyl-ACP methyl ester carboxylesterase n=2 Tax=Larkinella arboricola TaxID=643671 RepID=A0A327WQQ6_LARAB|nr:pimeloyl-ACP methyl ester carboxylesterase [Larkinella arboricola]
MGKHVRRVVRWLVGGIALLLVMAVGYLAWRSTGETTPITGPNGQPLPWSIAEWTPITVNGTRQWLLIRGQDRTKPVLLFLHGGPGLPELSLLTGHELEKHFVVVNWDQRGSGKSYSADVFQPQPGRPPFTVETLVDDAAQVSRYLCRRFGQPKIYVLAHSWGTLLGVLTVKKYPEHFRALFCISQIARQLEAEQVSYDWVLQQARLHGNDRQATKLLRQGRPPYPPDAWLDYLTWQRELVARYGGGMYRGHFFPLFIRSILLSPEYTLTDKLHYARGAQESVRYLWPAVVAIDLPTVAPELKVPYFLFQGVHDYQTPYPIARRYFNQLTAPQKRLFTFTNSAHSPIFEEPERFMHCFNSALASLHAGKEARP